MNILKLSKIFEDFIPHLKPERIVKKVWTPSALPFYNLNNNPESFLKGGSLLQGGIDSIGSAPRGAKFKVLQEVQVAGFSVITLTAEDLETLEKWLDKHEFPLESNHKDYLEHYVEKKWTFTVF